MADTVHTQGAKAPALGISIRPVYGDGIPHELICNICCDVSVLLYGGARHAALEKRVAKV
jgi:hypothetical protein